MSTVPAVIDALLAGLRARPALADVLISDGLPVEPFGDRRALTVGGKDEVTADGSSEWGAIGRSRRREDYTLRLYATATDTTSGTAQKVARDRAYEVVAEVGTFLRADPSLSGVIPDGEGAEMGSTFTLSQSGPGTGDEGRWAEVAFDVRVRTRI